MKKSFVRRVFAFLVGPMMVFLYALAALIAVWTYGILSASVIMARVASAMGFAGLMMRWLGHADERNPPERPHRNWKRAGAVACYLASALLFVEVALSFSIVDIGMSGFRVNDGKFSAVRILKSPGGEVLKVASGHWFGWEFKPCPLCADDPVMHKDGVLERVDLLRADGGTISAEVNATIVLADNTPGFISVYSKERDPQQFLRTATVDALKKCAAGIKDWPANVTYMNMACPAQSLFTLEYASISLAKR